MLHGEYLKCIKHIFFEQAPRNELLLKMQPLNLIQLQLMNHNQQHLIKTEQLNVLINET
jgi:hypothetical protein